MKEEKLKFNSFIFHKLNIVQPVNILFVDHFNNRTVSLYCKTIANEYKAIPHKNLSILFLANEGHRIDSHQSVSETVIDD